MNRGKTSHPKTPDQEAAGTVLWICGMVSALCWLSWYQRVPGMGRGMVWFANLVLPWVHKLFVMVGTFPMPQSPEWLMAITCVVLFILLMIPAGIWITPRLTTRIEEKRVERLLKETKRAEATRERVEARRNPVKSNYGGLAH